MHGPMKRWAAFLQSDAGSAVPLLAAAVLALSDSKIAKRLDAWRARQTKAVAKRPKD